jgi:hypothetical protein
MNTFELSPLGVTPLSSVFMVRPAVRHRVRDFFSSYIRNPNTRRAFRGAVRQFSGICAEQECKPCTMVTSQTP